MSVSLRPHGLQHTSLPCPSPTPGTCSNSCPLSRWCHPAISSSVVPYMLLLGLLSRFSHVRLCVTPCTAQPTRLLRPWDSPGKNTGVGCHFLLQCMKVESESEVAQSYLTLSDPMDCSLPGSSIHGIFRARVLEWGAIAFSPPLYVGWC